MATNRTSSLAFLALARRHMGNTIVWGCGTCTYVSVSVSVWGCGGECQCGWVYMCVCGWCTCVCVGGVHVCVWVGVHVCVCQIE